MKRMFPIVVLIAALVMLLSCSNGKVIGPPAIANISGSWEFLVTSNTNNASLTGIEVALKEGQVLIDGVVQPNGQLSASGTNQIAFRYHGVQRELSAKRKQSCERSHWQRLQFRRPA